MGKLKAAGLIESEKLGIRIYYHLRDDLSPATKGLIETRLVVRPLDGGRISRSMT